MSQRFNIFTVALQLSFRVPFAINTSSVARLLAGGFFKNCEAFFAFCDVIYCMGNIAFDNSMQSMNKKHGYNVEKYKVDELNLPWEKKCFTYFL